MLRSFDQHFDIALENKQGTIHSSAGKEYKNQEVMKKFDKVGLPSGHCDSKLSEGWSQRQTTQNEQPAQIRNYFQDDVAAGNGQNPNTDNKVLRSFQPNNLRSQKTGSRISPQTFGIDQKVRGQPAGSEKPSNQLLFPRMRQGKGNLGIDTSTSLSNSPTQQQKKGSKRGKKKRKKVKKSKGVELQKSVQNSSNRPSQANRQSIDSREAGENSRRSKLSIKDFDDGEVESRLNPEKIEHSVSVSNRQEGNGRSQSPSSTRKRQQHHRPTNSQQSQGFRSGKTSCNRDEEPSVVNELLSVRGLANTSKGQGPIKGQAPEQHQRNNDGGEYPPRLNQQKNQNMVFRPCWNTPSTKNNWFARRMKKTKEKNETCTNTPNLEPNQPVEQIKHQITSSLSIYPPAQNIKDMMKNTNNPVEANTAKREFALRARPRCNDGGNPTAGSTASSKVYGAPSPWRNRVGATGITLKRLSSDSSQQHQNDTDGTQKSVASPPEHLKLVNQRAWASQAFSPQRAWTSQALSVALNAERGNRRLRQRATDQQQLKLGQNNQWTGTRQDSPVAPKSRDGKEVHVELEPWPQRCTKDGSMFNTAMSNSTASIIQHKPRENQPSQDQTSWSKSKEHADIVPRVLTPSKAKNKGLAVGNSPDRGKLTLSKTIETVTPSERSSSRTSEPDSPLGKQVHKVSNSNIADNKIRDSSLEKDQKLSPGSIHSSPRVSSNTAVEVPPPPPEQNHDAKVTPSSRKSHSPLRSTKVPYQPSSTTPWRIHTKPANAYIQRKNDRQSTEQVQPNLNRTKPGRLDEKSDESNQGSGIGFWPIRHPVPSRNKQERRNFNKSQPDALFGIKPGYQSTTQAGHAHQQAQTPLCSRFPSAVTNRPRDHSNKQIKQSRFGGFNGKRRLSSQPLAGILGSRLDHQTYAMRGKNDSNGRQSALLSRISKAVMNQENYLRNTDIQGNQGDQFQMNPLKILHNRCRASSLSNSVSGNSAGGASQGAGHRARGLLQNQGERKKQQNKNMEKLRLRFERGRGKTGYENIAEQVKALRKGEKNMNSSLYHQLMSNWNPAPYRLGRTDELRHHDALGRGRSHSKGGSFNQNTPLSSQLSVSRAVHLSQGGAELTNQSYANAYNPQIMHNSQNTQSQHTPYLIYTSRGFLPSSSSSSPSFNQGATPPYPPVFMSSTAKTSSRARSINMQSTTSNIMSDVKDLGGNPFDEEENTNPRQRHPKLAASSVTARLQNSSQNYSYIRPSCLPEAGRDTLGCGADEDLPDEEIVIPDCIDGKIKVHRIIPANGASAESSTASFTEVSPSLYNDASVSASDTFGTMNGTAPSDEIGYSVSFPGSAGKSITEAEYLKLIQMLSQYRRQQKMNESLIEQNTRLFAEVKRLLLANARLKNCIWSQNRLPSPPPRGSDPSSSDAYSYHTVQLSSSQARDPSEQVPQHSNAPTGRAQRSHMFSD